MVTKIEQFQNISFLENVNFHGKIIRQRVIIVKLIFHIHLLQELRCFQLRYLTKLYFNFANVRLLSSSSWVWINSKELGIWKTVKSLTIFCRRSKTWFCRFLVHLETLQATSTVDNRLLAISIKLLKCETLVNTLMSRLWAAESPLKFEMPIMQV